MKSKLFLMVIGLMLVLFCYSSAQVPQLINYQGKLTNASGAPVTDTLQMVFTIYADSSGTISKWSETQTSVKVEKGVFNVLLGNVNPIPDSVFDGSLRYLGVKVESDPEITPRKAMVSVPYAYRASSGGGSDNKWKFRITDTADTSITTSGSWGIARYGATLYGDMDSTHVNLGVSCTTGISTHGNKYCTVAGGLANTASESATTVGGGYRNIASGFISTIAGGDSNVASNNFATVGGGHVNTASAYVATIAGGHGNIASGSVATIVGGESNHALSPYTFIGGGYGHYASASNATVGGGDNNASAGAFSTIGGGKKNYTLNLYGTIAGGLSNTAGGFTATIAGGDSNTANGDYTTIAGGYRNTNSSWYGTIGGGLLNIASGSWATVGGGKLNTANGDSAPVVGGGIHNIANSIYATVGGGVSNTASGYSSTVGGGFENLSAGAFSSIVGGYRDTITSSASYSYLFGIKSKLTQDSTFMVDMPHIRFGKETGGYEFPTQDGDTFQVLAAMGNGFLDWITLDPASGWTDNGSVVRLTGSSDSVGIGTITPTEKLQVEGNIKLNKNEGRLILRTTGHNDPGRCGILFDNNSVAPFLGDDTEDQLFDFYTTWSATRIYDAHLKVHGSATSSWGKYIELTHDGTDGKISTDTGDIILAPAANVGIGTTTPAYKLDVNGDINVSGSYNVKKGGVNYNHPDYVFEPDYKLMPLDELKKYVREHKCLPKVISSDEVKKNEGFKMDELLIQMLEKLEEQTLYIFQLEERITELEKKSQQK